METCTLYIGEIGSSCYNGQVVTMSCSCVFSKTGYSRSSKLCRIKSISNKLCMRNLEMIHGNKKKLFLQKCIFTSPSNYFLHFRKIASYNWKIIQLEMKFTSLVVNLLPRFMHRYFLQKLSPRGKLLHCNCIHGVSGV